MVWTLLGAIINPYHVLPYASATLTFIIFVITKYNNIQETIIYAQRAIYGNIQNRYKKFTHKILTKMQVHYMRSTNESLIKAKEMTSGPKFMGMVKRFAETGILEKDVIDDLHKKIDNIGDDEGEQNVLEKTRVFIENPNYAKNELDKLVKNLVKFCIF